MAKKADNSFLQLFQHIFKKTSPTHSTCLHPTHTHTNTHIRLIHIQHIHAVNSTYMLQIKLPTQFNLSQINYSVQCYSTTASLCSCVCICVFSFHSPTLFTMLRLRQEFSTAIFCGLSPFLTSLKKTQNI